MEIIGRMAATRTNLLAAIIAVGCCAPLSAQTPDAPVNVDAPRAVVMPPASPFSLLPDPVQSAGFRISGATTSSPSATSASLAPPADSANPASAAPSAAAPVSSTPNQPVAPYMPMYPPTHTHAVAPAWRWHGYGAVTPTPDTQPMMQSAGDTQKPVKPMPSAVSLPTPSAPEMSLGGEGRQPVVAPADALPVPLPPGQPLSSADPTWRAAGQRGSYVGVNPMTTVPQPWLPADPRDSALTTVAATSPEWHGQAVFLDAPRPAGTYLARAVCETVALPVAAIQQVAYTSTPAKTSLELALPAIRATIERTCVGRAHDVNLVMKNSKSLLVRLKVWQAGDAEYLANVISRLPELGPYQVFFEIQASR